MPYSPHLRSLVLSLQGHPDLGLEVLGSVDTATLDGHQSWHLAEAFAMAGDHDRAIQLLEQAVERGNYPYDFFERHGPFYASLRGTPAFERVLEMAAKRKAEFFE
jgi:hypothetical protein